VKAVVRTAYGSVEVAERAKPEPSAGEVLVRVRAAALNASDWYALAGRPYLARLQMGLFRPRSDRLGTDYAGVVEAVGEGVREFRAGDEVFGGRAGALAEYVCVPEDRSIAGKPASVSFEQAGAVGIAGLTALQGLRRLRPGRRVLVNGASGGVGTFAVQIAKALGAEVTAVCSTRNVDQARALGADRVVDYAHDDFACAGVRYDVILDVAGTRPWRELRRVLEPDGVLVLVGGPKAGRVLGPLARVLRVRLVAGRRATFFVAKFDKEDIRVLRDLLERGRVVPVVSETYAVDDVEAAFRAMGAGHAQGKIVVTF
jgi:NADPH:quinone reductase-like Zn-dependent oxidoreductase